MNEPMSRARMSPPPRVVAIFVAAAAILLCLSARQADSWQLQLEPLAVNQHPTLVQAPANTFASVAANSQASSDSSSKASEIPQQQQQASSQSVAGKIIDTVGAAAVTALKEATLSSLNGGSSRLEAKSATTNQQQQFMKPSRKTGSDLATKEQEIYRLHESVQQYIAPARKTSSSASSSSSFVGESDGRDSSALSSIFDNLKSGITSRSSIVKAISDNKLARTLSDVGKTIGSNKYVAGAAAASALAALGLAVTKLFTPYMFAGAFPGSEPLMTSGSSSMGSYIDPSRNSYGEYPGATSFSSMDNLIGSTPPMGGYSSSSFDSSRASPGPYMDTASSNPPPAIYQPGAYMNIGGPDGKPVFITYKPAYSSQAPQTYQVVGGQQQQQHDVNGHYTGFYSSQTPNEYSPSSQYSQPMPTSNIYSNFGSTAEPNSQLTYTGNQQGVDMMSSGDQIPSASAEVATYAARPTTNLIQGQSSVANRAPSNSGRRYGAVPLKLKYPQDTRARSVVKPSATGLEFAKPTFVKTFNYPNAGDKSSFATPPAFQPVSDSSKSRYFQQQQQQPPQPMVMSPSVSNKDQGQAAAATATPRVSTTNGNGNSNNNPQPASYRLIRPSTQQTADRNSPVANSSPWISVSSGSIDHQDRTSTGSSSSSGGNGESNGPKGDRVFRTLVKGSDYDLQASASELSSSSSSSTGGETLANREQPANDDNNVIKQLIDVSQTKNGGAKLTAGQQQQTRQLQSASSQLDSSSSSSSSGGLKIMSPPRQSPHMEANNDNNQQTSTVDVEGSVENGNEESAATNSNDADNSQQTQRRGQSAGPSQGKSADISSEDSSAASK